MLRLWDLRSSTSTPLAELHGHTAGIISMSWCPNDAGLVLSSAKDNRTLMWDLFTGQSMFELPSSGTAAPAMGSGQFFSGGGGGQRRFNVQWSPKIRAVASACTFDGKVQVWGLAASANGASGRAPKWCQPLATANFGFGGKLAVVNARPSASPQPGVKEYRPVHIHKIMSDPSIIHAADLLEKALTGKDFKGHCDKKIASVTKPHDRSAWSFMKILFENDARAQLLFHLGYNAETIKIATEAYLGKKNEAKVGEAAEAPVNSGEENDAENVFSTESFKDGLPSSLSSSSSKSVVPPADTSKRISGGPPAPVYTEASEDLIKRSLLVGDFEAAVEICLQNHQLSEALLLSCQGGADLWNKTQEACIAAAQGRPFMKIVKAMVKGDLSSLVEEVRIIAVFIFIMIRLL